MTEQPKSKLMARLRDDAHKIAELNDRASNLISRLALDPMLTLDEARQFAQGLVRRDELTVCPVGCGATGVHWHDTARGLRMYSSSAPPPPAPVTGESL